MKTLTAQLKSVVQEFKPRVESAKAALAQEQPATFALRRMEALFGKEFRVLPLIRASAPLDTLAEALLRRDQAQDAPEPEVWNWLQAAAQVREGAGRLDLALTSCEALSATAADPLRVAQLPVEDPDRWAALKPLTGKTPAGGRLSLSVLMPSGTTLQQPVAGLLVDEWVEVVPQPRETTGVSFHFDAPGACAPQTLLLAVSPDPRRAWNLETLEAIVLETLEAAKLRAVDLEALNAGGQYLPALCLAFNQANETISTTFR